MPGWRVGFCVGNPDLVGALATIKGYLDYGIFAPTQLAAATALTSCDADVAGNRALYKHRAERARATRLREAGWAVRRPPGDHVRLGAACRRARGPGGGGLRRRAAGEGGRGGGAGGRVRSGREGIVRFSLIESDDRVRRAAPPDRQVAEACSARQDTARR